MDDKEREFQEVLNRIEASPKTALEKKAFFVIVKLIFYNGLEQKEISNIKVGDVTQGGSVLAEITPTPGKGTTRLSDEVKETIEGYIRELRSGSSVTPDSLLFPAYGGESGVRKLRRHFEPFLGFFSFDDLRRAGVNNYYETLLRNRFDQLTAVKETVRQFRLGKRTLDDILRGTTQPAGKKSPEKLKANERFYYLIIELDQSLKLYEILINNRVPGLVKEFFKVVDDLPEYNRENGLPGESDGTALKHKLLDAVIEEIRLPLNTFAKNSKIIKQESLITNFEDTDNAHTPEEKLEFKKIKLLEYIKKIRRNIRKRDRNKLVSERKKELQAKQKGKIKKSKKRKQGYSGWIPPDEWQRLKNFWPREPDLWVLAHLQTTPKGRARTKFTSG